MEAVFLMRSGMTKGVPSMKAEQFLPFCPSNLIQKGNSRKGMDPSEIYVPPSTPKWDDMIVQHGFLSTTVHTHIPLPPPHPSLPRPEYDIASMYIGPMGKFPSPFAC